MSIRYTSEHRQPRICRGNPAGIGTVYTSGECRWQICTLERYTKTDERIPNGLSGADMLKGIVGETGQMTKENWEDVLTRFLSEIKDILRQEYMLCNTRMI